MYSRKINAFHSLQCRHKYVYHTQAFTKKRQRCLIEEKELRCKTTGGIIRHCNKFGVDKYILVQGRYSNKWSFPKGHVKEGEDMYQGCLREIKEETGLEWLSRPITSFRLGYGYYYFFELDDEIDVKQQDNDEIVQVKWVTVSEMKQLELNADVSRYFQMVREE
jgi:8-oxo-dGTP pyrophosphatase MutT (NUDIX family)